jgi:hypothetical protein
MQGIRDLLTNRMYNALVITLVTAAFLIYCVATIVVAKGIVSKIPTAAPSARASPTAYSAPALIQPGRPAGATGLCGDGTYTYSSTKRGACSHHNGVASWWGP